MESVFANWYERFPSPWTPVALVLVATLAGALVGAERERKEKPAGLRPMMLVSLGSCVFTILSFVLSPNEGSRIAAQVVTGVGFLGAGAILHDRGGVRGVTTAATVWTMAAIGMVIGAGYAVAGLALSVFTLVLLLAVVEIETRYLGPCSISEAALVFDAAGGKAHVKVEEILDQYHIEPSARSHMTQEDGSIRLRFRFRYCNAHKHHREFLTQLASLDEVREIAREVQAR